MSGIQIPDEAVDELEQAWATFLASQNIVQLEALESTAPLAERSDEESATFTEGSVRQHLVNIYESNPQARRRCIRHYGLTCVSCGFNFGDVYGAAGVDLIHVHHLTPLSETRGEYQLDPIRDLRPVCANCHAVIHRHRPAYTIEEVQAMLRNRQ
jgi:5-methylcytosine-specific restriction enzyme A